MPIPPGSPKSTTVTPKVPVWMVLLTVAAWWAEQHREEHPAGAVPEDVHRRRCPRSCAGDIDASSAEAR